jgi:uncharacterized protein with NAD-binding domain and iron-sulfur cluster
MLEDRVLDTGLDPLDTTDFRAWLRHHGASRITLDSSLLRGAYDLAFSYEDGDSAKPNLAAGVALRSLLRTVFTVRGSIIWKMQAGMGETVFTPLYLLLASRGVRFEFFHRVVRLEPTPDGTRIGRIVITRQVTLRKGPYEPLVEVKGLGCWRDEPDYQQLLEGDELLGSGANLESYWASWAGGDTRTLTAGADFDVVVLGIPIGALGDICGALVATRPAWRDMLLHVKTIQTQGFQIWLDADLRQLGWTAKSPVLGSFIEPLSTWADMSHLLAVEDWPRDARVRQLAYFCGVMPTAPELAPASDTAFPVREYEKSRATAIDFLDRYMPSLWPCAGANGNAKFSWDRLIAPVGAVGQERFDSQYWRPNIDPSERYVLALAGTTQYRLRTNESGYQNLILTGDWIRNGFNTPGCIESAVISGRQAARAISGRPTTIIGETDIGSLDAWWVWLLRLASDVVRWILSWMPRRQRS